MLLPVFSVEVPGEAGGKVIPDATVVINTYQGKHNQAILATLHGNQHQLHVCISTSLPHINPRLNNNPRLFRMPAPPVAFLPSPPTQQHSATLQAMKKLAAAASGTMTTGDGGHRPSLVPFRRR